MPIKQVLFSRVFLLILWLIFGALLFFLLFKEGYFSQLKKIVREEGVADKAQVVLVYKEELPNFSPLRELSSERSRLANLYEGLVELDENLKVKPGIAISWGKVNESKWQFRLRRDVLFHNGQPLTLDDVAESLKKQETLLQTTFNFVYNTNLDPYLISFETTESDEIFLANLARVFIFPANVKLESLELYPIGTGPYRFFKRLENQDTILERFENYWGDKPYFKEVLLKSVDDKFARLDSLNALGTDLLYDVPVLDLDQTVKQNYVIVERPGLDVNFLMFNLQNKYFRDRDLREFVKQNLDRSRVARNLQEYVSVTDQFVSAGVFGYDFYLQTKEQTAPEVGEFLSQKGLYNGFTVELYCEKSLEPVAEWLKGELLKVRIAVNLKLLDADTLLEKIRVGEPDLYLAGWKYETGEALDFFLSVIHSQTGNLGGYNGMHYSSPEIDELIERSKEDKTPERRLRYLQQINEQITEKDIVGIPLFETKRVYAVKKGIQFVPRLDGNVLAKEIREKEK
ncbi:hypothetical protein COT40_02220 [Candidatus Peregrinibacteria bacterium CG08_land_8_20_14_0_20_41_10]|nr:MAG: hypothetical protein AUJ78_01195 [Candidatus Peregrinibacteria bacterium CG1_02_41_10]PIS32031.1 MAG: hypothetical protein COT40_02220 [Candidatus Peregrinibacteria bacterium CG08_land_8_20_14_0_20_41_10]